MFGRPGADRDRARGALLGTFVGDALGMPFEGTAATDIPARVEMVAARRGRGTYTDDTQMMIALGESLLEPRLSQRSSWRKRASRRSPGTFSSNIARGSKLATNRLSDETRRFRGSSAWPLPSVENGWHGGQAVNRSMRRPPADSRRASAGACTLRMSRSRRSVSGWLAAYVSAAERSLSTAAKTR